MAKKQKKPDPVILPDLALTSFSDMMTLCLTFFVLLFSMSEIRKPKAEQTMRAMLQQLGMQTAQSAPVMTFTPSTRIRQPSVLRMGPPGQNPEVQTLVEDQRVKQVLGAKELFAPGSARLEPAGRQLLRDYARDLRGYANRIEIAGFTGDADTEAGAVDTWMLGAERARNVIAYLVNECHLDERRFRLLSGASNEPRDDSGLGRVEIVMTDYPVTNR